MIIVLGWAGLSLCWDAGGKGSCWGRVMFGVWVGE